MASKIDPSELATITDLLKDFAVDQSITAEEVYETSWSRFNTLDQAPLHEIFKEGFWVKFLHRPLYAKLPIAFHKFIYEGLFTFAGNYRISDDPLSGRIYFGRQNAQQRKPPFTGSSPKEIEMEVFEAAWFLKRRTKNPLYQAVRFYQKFVYVHPFYDANGRIGRLITNMYLANHNMIVSWSEFDGKSKFLKKLNRCHLNPTEETFGYLVDYLRGFTLPLSDFEE